MKTLGWKNKMMTPGSYDEYNLTKLSVFAKWKVMKIQQLNLITKANPIFYRSVSFFLQNFLRNYLSLFVNWT